MRNIKITVRDMVAVNPAQDRYVCPAGWEVA